jgi:hypothetical protein
MWIQSDVTLDGQVDTLPDVTGLALLAADAGFTSKISWDPVDDVRPLRFEVLYNFANSLPGAVSLGLVDTTEYPVSVAGHYWIRTNFIAAYSPSPAHIEVTEAELTIAAALTPTLTNDSFNVPADSAGVVSSYSGASGSFVVLQGTSDVSSNFALSTVSGGNPQALTIGYVAQAYSVTAGLDAGEDTATVKIRATGSGAFAGIAIDKIFSLGKNKQGSTGAAGANAKTLTVQTDRTAFTFDGAANLTPGTQSAVVTANPQNFVGGNVVWSYVDNLGTSSATLATLVTATSTNVRTVPSAVFTGTPTRLWLRVVATGQGAESGISDSDIVYRLDAGSGVLTLIMSNPAHNVPTDSAGAGGDFTGAHGQLTAFYGTTDVTAAATLSEVSETSLTGDVNTATNSPVGSQPKGYYRVTALSADTGTYKMRAVYNPGSGNITVDQDFTVTKARQGSTGTSGVSPVLATPTVPLIVIRTYADGTPKPGQLPLDIGTVVTQAGSGISLTSLALVTQSNLTATEDNVNVTVSAISGTSGFVAYTATAGGQTVAVTVPYTTIPDGAAGGFATSQDFSGSISGASYTDASPTITMNVPASGQINVSLVGEYYVGTPAGNFLAAVKMRYQINGGGYGDVSGSAVTGSEALYISAGNPGNTVGSFNTGLLSITGLTPGDNFELRYQYKKSSGSKSATLDSAVTMYAEQE